MPVERLLDSLCINRSNMENNSSNRSANEIITTELLNSITELSKEIRIINAKLTHLEQISKKVDEIHRLHFPKDELEKNANLHNRFLAEIIMGIPRKRRKS